MVNKLQPTDLDISDLQEKVGAILLSLLLLLLSLFIIIITINYKGAKFVTVNWKFPLEQVRSLDLATSIHIHHHY